MARRLGGDPDKSGSVSGSVHRGWLDLKAAGSPGMTTMPLSPKPSAEKTSPRVYTKTHSRKVFRLRPRHSFSSRP